MSAKAAAGLGEGRRWPDYRAMWRWHFYAGLFCLPFICWLALTGSIYLFRPDIEGWLDRPYEALQLATPRRPPSAEAAAALAAVPGSRLSRYEPPATATGAAQVVVAARGRLMRVYIRPDTLKPMRIVQDDRRPLELVAHLHGQLLLGDPGSMLVELAASWAVVMILTGLYLWFPRGRFRAAGLVYPRLNLRGRALWRDLHSVAGLWASGVTLFLLLSGLPWAVSWGNYLTWVRNHWSATAGVPDWPIGATNQPAAARVAAAPRRELPRAMAGMSREEMASMSPSGLLAAETGGEAPVDLRALDVVVPIAAKLQPPRPVWVTPPASGGSFWTVSSQVQDRPRRVTYRIDAHTGDVVSARTFAGENIVDKVVNVAVATHEGQLFGRINQAILLLTAIGLLVVSTSAMVMWWRRRPAHALGAPEALARPRFTIALAATVIALATVLPLFGLSLLAVLLCDLLILRRLPAAERWLGLSPAS